MDTERDYDPREMAVQNKVKREKSAIEQELNQVHEAIDHLGSLLNMLSDKVQPVSFPEPEGILGEALADSDGPRGSSEFYTSIYEARKRLENTHFKIKNITRKLEV